MAARTCSSGVIRMSPLGGGLSQAGRPRDRGTSCILRGYSRARDRLQRRRAGEPGTCDGAGRAEAALSLSGRPSFACTDVRKKRRKRRKGAPRPRRADLLSHLSLLSHHDTCHGNDEERDFFRFLRFFRRAPAALPADRRARFRMEGTPGRGAGRWDYGRAKEAKKAKKGGDSVTPG